MYLVFLNPNSFLPSSMLYVFITFPLFLILLYSRMLFLSIPAFFYFLFFNWHFPPPFPYPWSSLLPSLPPSSHWGATLFTWSSRLRSTNEHWCPEGMSFQNAPLSHLSEKVCCATQLNSEQIRKMVTPHMELTRPEKLVLSFLFCHQFDID